MSVIIDTVVLDKIAADLPRKAGAIVEKYGIAIAGNAAAMAPIDTGALRNSIVAESGMVGPLTFYAQDGVEYGIFQELGTYKMAAQPFMVPTVERWAERFFDAFKEAFE